MPLSVRHGVIASSTDLLHVVTSLRKVDANDFDILWTLKIITVDLLPQNRIFASEKQLFLEPFRPLAQFSKILLELSIGVLVSLAVLVSMTICVNI